MLISTLGHGNLDADVFASLLESTGIEGIVDVRRYPGSRRLPHFGREPLEALLSAGGAGYWWMPSLGGRRRPDAASPNTALRNQQFRAYADHMATEEFRGGVAELLDVATSWDIAVLCSESVWWRCHRRLLADHLVLVHEVRVEHVFHDGRRQEHPPLPQARRCHDHVVYRPGQGSPDDGHG